MSRTQKILLTLLALVLVTAGGVTFALAAPAIGLAPGLDLATVRVHEKQEGFTLFLPVPAGLVDLGVRTAASSCDLGAELGEARVELERWGPLVEASLAALDDAPDTTLVAVDTPRESVRIEKRGRKLHVSVRSPEADVDVAVPLTLVASVLDSVRHAAPPPAEA